MLNICIVAGARPNFIKFAPIIRSVNKFASAGEEVACRLVYTGPQDDKEIETSLFEDLQINTPDVYLGVDCESLNELTGKVMSAFEEYLKTNETDVVLVADDLASTMAVAIVTKKMGKKLAHLVAGTRSFDMNMPKEINRLVIDGLSDYLFTAGTRSNSIVCREGAALQNVYMVGNILMDTLRFNMPRLTRPAVADDKHLEDKKYIVFTVNRKALIDEENNLCEMVEKMIEAAGDVPVIAPLRERARKVLLKYEGRGGFHIAEPLSYNEFGYLAAHAMGVITDSGNVAEEATFNGVPCATLNNYTEHEETIKQGTNVLVGEDPEKLAENVRKMVEGQWKHASLPERWDGRTADRIVRALMQN